MVWQAFLTLVMLLGAGHGSSSPPTHGHHQGPGQSNDQGDVVPIANSLVAPSAASPAPALQQSLPTYFTPHPVTQSSHPLRYHGSRTDHGQPRVQQLPSYNRQQGNVVRNYQPQQPSPSYSYGYSMNDKSIAQQFDGNGLSTGGYSWLMPGGGGTMFMSGNLVNPVTSATPEVSGHDNGFPASSMIGLNGVRHGDHSSQNTRFNQQPQSSYNQLDYEYDSDTQEPVLDSSYVMKILGTDSRWIEISDKNGERSGYYTYVNPEGNTVLVRYSAGLEGFKILESRGVPGLATW